MRAMTHWVQVLAVVTACGVTFLTCPAQARPGTPKDLEIFDCSKHIDSAGNPNYDPNRKLYDDPPRPALCVTFTNTAPERVIFEIELASWAQLLNHNSVSAECLWGYAQSYRCTAVDNFIGNFHASAERIKDDPDWAHEGFKLGNLDFRRQYCIRVRTRAWPTGLDQFITPDVISAQPVSLNWTDWACQITAAEPVPPPLPPKPTPPRVAVRTSKHGDKVTVTWEGAQNVGYYSVDGKLACRSSSTALVPSAMQTMVSDREYTFTLDVSWADAMDRADDAYNYRVCNHNDSGVACSEWTRSTPDIPQCLRDAEIAHAVQESPAEANMAPRAPDPNRVFRQPVDPRILTPANNVELARQVGRLRTANDQPFAGPPYGQWMTGTFDSDFGELTLTTERGSYTYHDGRMTVSSHLGPNMDGSWQESSGTHRCEDGLFRGRFHFAFTETGFTGQFGYCDGPTDAGNWNGKRHEQVIH